MKKQIVKLLQEHPKATEVLQEWFITKLHKSITKKIPEEFQKFVESQTIDLEKLSVMIEKGPSGLLYVFDDHDIYINIVYQDEVGFVWDMGHPHGGDPSIPYNTRMKAEHKAIFKAIEILEEKLKPKKDEKSEEKS
tara:strand:+ start:1431 stop:1838 length:408 start_codon:yes stop_codon:yes gene_type:complete